MSTASASERLTAVLHAVQYLGNLSAGQDPWAELARAMGSFFGNDVVLVVRAQDGGALHLVHSTASREIPVAEVLRLADGEIRAVLASGFLGSQVLPAPACSLAFLPLPRDRRTDAVAIVGRAGQEPFSKEELEILLALGGLFANVVARVETEQELRAHRQSLEELIARRTAELQNTNARLVQESAERRQAEVALERAHAELEQIFETAGDGLRLIDQHGVVLKANATHARRLGRPISEIVGRRCEAVSNCGHCRTDACPITRILSGASRVESTVSREYPEGKGEDVVISTPFRAKDGSVLGIVQVFHDVTERRRAEEALRESREWLRVTLTSIGDAVIACDTAGRVTFINPVAAALTGWPVEQALNQLVANVFRIISEQTREPVEDIVGRVLREKHTAALANHTVLLGRDGQETPIADSAAPILDDHGEVAGVVLVFHDVIAARDARRERETTIEFLRLVNQSTGTPDLVRAATEFFQSRSDCEAVGIRLRDGDDYPYFETRGFPKEFVQLESSLCTRDSAGKVRRDTIGSPVLECMCGNVICSRIDPAKPFFTAAGSFWTNSTTELLASTTDDDRPARTRSRCSGEGYESVALVPLRVGADRLGLLQLNDHRKGMFSRERVALWERLAGYLAVAVARVRAEERLRESEQSLREADQRKNEFLAVLSHELRNPLAPITNSLYVLDRAEPGSDQARRAQTTISRQAGQLSRLVDDLLDVTRISRNKIRLQRHRIDFNLLVQRTVEDHRSLFEKNDVSLTLGSTGDPVFVNGDANRLAQVTGNLLTNAAKFTPRGGSTSVSVSICKSTNRAELRVRDSGVGLAPEMLSRLFQPFTQADSTLDRSKGGLGLGLALVKGIVELHGGDVSVRSDGPDRGAEVLVCLPLDLDGAPEAQAEHQGRAQGRRRVLIIEDNIDAADSLCEVLQLSGHDVEVAYCGPEGIAKARAFLPEVVLCDIGLPEMNGYEVARVFRDDATLAGAQLVALSGYALPEDLRRAREAGFDNHISKPPNLQALEKLLASPEARVGLHVGDTA